MPASERDFAAQFPKFDFRVLRRWASWWHLSHHSAESFIRDGVSHGWWAAGRDRGGRARALVKRAGDHGIAAVIAEYSRYPSFMKAYGLLRLRQKMLANNGYQMVFDIHATRQSAKMDDVIVKGWRWPA
jgi:hypothetical protein